MTKKPQVIEYRFAPAIEEAIVKMITAIADSIDAVPDEAIDRLLAQIVKLEKISEKVRRPKKK